MLLEMIPFYIIKVMIPLKKYKFKKEEGKILY